LFYAAVTLRQNSACDCRFVWNDEPEGRRSKAVRLVRVRLLRASHARQQDKVVGRDVFDDDGVRRFDENVDRRSVAFRVEGDDGLAAQALLRPAFFLVVWIYIEKQFCIGTNLIDSKQTDTL
jgi:hypothetical protein